MTNNESHFYEILKVLDQSGVLKDMVLIGSWCELFYKQVFLDFEPSIRTTDLDFYIPDAKRVKQNGEIVSSLKELNYEIVYDCLTNKTRFISPDGFELEFLTKLTRGNLKCIKIGNTGIFAETLPYVDIFTGNYIEVKMNGLMVKVASPASYVLQKLLINEERKIKAEKDIQSIKRILVFIKASPKSIKELNELFVSLPKKWQRKINKVVDENNISFN